MDPPGQISLLATIAIFTCWLRGGHARLIPEDAHVNKQAPVSKGTLKDFNIVRVISVPVDWDLKQLRSFLTAIVIVQDLLLSPESYQSKRILLPKPIDNQLTGDQYLILNKAFLGITTLYTLPPNAHKIE
ncbi:unnamed protein product [Clonostachys solani]|uniref:Uncharacterized protein n=1 Tax=Clonostachys solani TaxID=160281 RepID=A0A9P0EMK6_9HYPO|nr:unnamed protein product [Clonostachys solani]